MKLATIKLAGILALSGILLASPAARAESVQEKIDAIDQRQKVLERKLELEKEASKDKATVSAGKDGFAIKTADGKFQLKLKALVQADGRFFLDVPETANQGTNTFVARRVRPIIEGTLFDRFDFRIMPDFGGGQTVLQDAYIDARLFKELVIRGGKFKEPVGLERLQSGGALLFVERALPTQLVPNRDLGFQVQGDVWEGFFSYALGVFNGVLDGGSGDVDTNDGKDIAARVFFHPFIKTDIEALKGLGVGVGGNYGKQRGTAASTNLPSYRTSGQQIFFRYLTDAATPANTVIADGANFRISPQLYYYWGPLGVLGEYVQTRQSVGNAAGEDSLTHRAWQIATSYVLTGDKASFKGVKPKKPFSLKDGTWGAVELTARYNELDIDDDTFPTYANINASATRARAFAGGVNWYLNDNIKLVGNYEQTLFRAGGAAGTNRRTEKSIQTRLQVSF